MSSEKLKLLVWKNCLVQIRHKWQTLFEIASPALFSVLLVLVRGLVAPTTRPHVTYSAFQPTFFNMSAMAVGNSSLSRSGTLAFSPENPLTRKAATNAMAAIADDNFGSLTSVIFGSALPDPVGYSSSGEMEAALIQPKAMDHVLAGIQFDDIMANATEWPDDITVTLRFPAVMRTAVGEHPMVANWRTNLLFPLFPQAGPREPGDSYGGKTPGYSSEMFLAIQHGVSRGIIKQKCGKLYETEVYMRRLPQGPFREDPLLAALERFVTVIVMIGFSYTFVNTVRAITAEKELQLKETMAIMGLPSGLHWLAWFIKQFSFLLVSAVLMLVLFKIPISKTESGEWVAVFTFTPWSILLFFMILFIIVSLAFAFMVSVFFSRANSAASFMGLMWFASYSVFMFTQMLPGRVGRAAKLALSLVSNTAVGFAFQMLVRCEGNGRGLQWGEFFKPISYHDRFQPGHVALMLALDAALYTLVAMYVEKIRPGRYGVPLPWYFPFTKRFWRSNGTVMSEVVGEEDDADAEQQAGLVGAVRGEGPAGARGEGPAGARGEGPAGAVRGEGPAGARGEGPAGARGEGPAGARGEGPAGARAGVTLVNLSKIYKGKKKAVDNLNLTIYENEITVLLGHNGAGKTTTISMLTGMVPPSAGAVLIGGYNIVAETERARSSLGVCPQHNVLFPDLTVAEHIVFYARLKGLPHTEINEEVDHFVKLLNLEEKRDVPTALLSGGQRRRVSAAAALCGRARVVLLDEPSAGLDPAARRALWDLLQKEKKGRTIVLTTHFMDEADVLADRVAIMSGGRLRCYGTPHFLKKHYGVGYKLTLLKSDDCDVDEVTRFLKKYVPTVQKYTNIGSEVTYTMAADNVSQFPEMLRALEQNRDSLRVSSYGLSVTSLKEVFMKAGVEDNAESEAIDGYKSNGLRSGEEIELTENGNYTDPMFEGPVKRVRGLRLFANHVRAMLMKLALSTRRSKVTSSIQLTWPVINVAISIILSRSWRFLAELPPLALDLERGFSRTQTLLAQEPNLTEDSMGARFMSAYKDYFETSPYPGMTLTDIGAEDMETFYMTLSATDVPRVRHETLVGATFSRSNVTAWFSNYGYHDSAVSLALVNNAILRALSPGTSLKFVNHPLPYSLENWMSVMVTGSSMAFQFSFNLGFCLGLVSSFVVLFVIQERTSGAKLLQRVSGVRPAVMWVTAFLWDWVWLLLIHLLIIITLACFQETTLSTPRELGRAMLVLMVFSAGVIPLHYLASFYFDEAATGFTKMCFVNTFAGCMPFLITEVLRLPHIGSEYYARVFDFVFTLLPTYSACKSLRDMSVTSFSMLACDGLCDTLQLANCTRHTVCHRLHLRMCCVDDDPFLQWEEPGVARYLVTTAFVGVVAFAILLIKEYDLLNELFYRQRARAAPAPPPLEAEDSDVAAERRRVCAGGAGRWSLECRDLTKRYGDLTAVDRLTFGVDRGECFGLLGVNGAGKTSTFRMLTGDARISHGDALVHGLSLNTRIQDVYRHIGYCPQFDALFDNLSARETLRIFCLLRGIPSRAGAASSMRLANQLGFTKHFDKKVYECSGGTKRKISTAVALLGDAPLILLDEPTTGMDPASKRLVWASISSAVRAGRSVVLTSHSMEECEALCSRLTVMVSGRLHCLGPLQHLKTKFSQGYTLMVKCKPVTERDVYAAKINEYITENISSAKLIETHLGISTYSIGDTTPTPTLPWWRVFEVMEQARRLYPVEHYSVSQTTLDQVFLQLTGLHAAAR